MPKEQKHSMPTLPRLALLAALSLGSLGGASGQDDNTPRNDGVVKERVGPWRIKDAKMDDPDVGDRLLPDTIEYSGEEPSRIITIRKTFLPPNNFVFRPLVKKDQQRIDLARETRQWVHHGNWSFWSDETEYADIWADIENTLLINAKSVIEAAELQKGAERIQVEAIVAESQTAAQYPLRCEGNLAHKGGGGSGGSVQPREHCATPQKLDTLLRYKTGQQSGVRR
jgi:hypothetical protein